MNQEQSYPYFRVVKVNDTTRQLWFRTIECNPSMTAMTEVNDELYIQSSGAFSLRLDAGDLSCGLVEIRRSAVFPEDVVDLSFEEAIDRVKTLLCKTASGHASFDFTKCPASFSSTRRPTHNA